MTPEQDIQKLVKLYGEALRAQNEVAASLFEAAAIAAADAEAAMIKYHAFQSLASEAGTVTTKKC